MERFTITVMLEDGTLADYDAANERGSSIFSIFKDEALIAVFEAEPSGNWLLRENPGGISMDLKQRIENQLNGLLS